MVLALPIKLRRRSRLLAYLSMLGPGLIAATAGDDPGGIATYSSVGAKYGYDFLWVLVVIAIGLAVVQEMSARMGAVTGKGFSDLVRERFSIHWTALVMLSLFVANAVLIVSEFAGMGAAAELFGIPRWPAIALAAVALWWLVVKGNYNRVEFVFLLMTLVFLGYPVAAIMARPDWLDVGRHLVTPSFHLSSDYLLLFVATVGTTISPYMQLYLQSAVADRGASADDIKRERVDAYSGAVFSIVIAASIVVATGATLFRQHIEVNTAEDAAQALAPLAGPFAGYLFGIGLFGAAVLAAAVLPLTTTYSITEAIGFERGVSRSFSEAPVFVGLFTGLIALGAVLAMIPGIDVIRLLIVSYVVNGLLLPIELVTMVKLVNDRTIMGRHANGPVRNVLAYGIVAGVSLLSLVYLVITVLGLFGIGPGT